MAAERLYQVLPAIYRQRDAEQGEPLRALLAVMEAEFDAVAADMDGLYDNWFIETCAEWVVPYLGDLLGVRGLNGVSPATFSQRARVANALRHRRRKGTAAMLEQLARDVTGWPAHAVEFFGRLQTTQYLNHLRPGNRTPDLGDTARLELLGGPLEEAAHTVDVRHPDRGGRYNIPHVGIFLWRLQSYPLTRTTARTLGGGRYTFDPLGGDLPLFNQPLARDNVPAEATLPQPLRRRPLYDELAALLADPTSPRVYFNQQQPVLQVATGPSSAGATPVDLPELRICDLSVWRAPTAPVQVLVDPVLGRLAFAAASPPAVVEVSYSYGFSGDVGGGPYNRQESAQRALPAPPTWQIGVSQDTTFTGPEVLPTLTAALQAWSLQPPGSQGVITIMDSRTYPEDLAITIKPGSRLLLVAADWPQPDPPGSPRVAGQFIADRVRPHLLGNITVTGEAGADGLWLNGLLIEGALTVSPGDLGVLDLAHCTLAPTHGGLQVQATGNAGEDNQRLQIAIARSITGPIRLPDQPGAVAQLQIGDSIVDGAAPPADPLPLTVPAIQGPGTDVTLTAVTVLGSVDVRTLEASNCLCAGAATARLRQSGCVRFSYLPDGSRVARRYRCQPDLALSQTNDPAEQQRIRRDLVPVFTSRRYGDPAYGQLSRDCPAAIRTGADDFAEQGGFHHLQQPQRAANLVASLDEYLRFGLEAGLFYVT